MPAGTANQSTTLAQGCCDFPRTPYLSRKRCDCQGSKPLAVRARRTEPEIDPDRNAQTNEAWNDDTDSLRAAFRVCENLPVVGTAAVRPLEPPGPSLASAVDVGPAGRFVDVNLAILSD